MRSVIGRQSPVGLVVFCCQNVGTLILVGLHSGWAISSAFWIGELIQCKFHVGLPRVGYKGDVLWLNCTNTLHPGWNNTFFHLKILLKFKKGCEIQSSL